MNRSLLFLFFLVLGFSVFGQKYPLVTYSTEEGLPQSQVTSFAQDEKGYLWIGTLGGLAKFGGTKFNTFSTRHGLLNNRITALTYFDGKLWIGHDGGISFSEADKFQSIEFEGGGNDRSRKVSKIIKFKNKILVCSIRGGLFEFKQNALKKIELGTEDYDWIRDAYIYDDRIYLATRKGILSSNDGLNYTIEKELGEYSFSGVSGREKELIFATFSDGLFIKNVETGILKTVSSEFLQHRVKGLYVDRKGDIWLNGSHGAVQIKGEDNIKFYNTSNGLPINAISCFFNDNADNIWIGSQGKGMFRFPSADFQYYDISTGLPSDLYTGGFQDAKGDYYLSSFDKGVIKRSKSNEISFSIGQDVAVWASLKNVDKKHWFGTAGYLAEVAMNGDVLVHSYEQNDNIPGWKITALYRISDSSMYVGGNGGVALYKEGEFFKIGKDEIGTVRDFEMLGDQLYCATNLGLFKFNNGDFRKINHTDAVVYNLEKDGNGALWYGTEEGLFRFKDGVSKRFELLPDPGSNFIDFMNFKNNQLFIGTNNGFFIVGNLNSDELSIKRFGIWDGIVDLETNLNSGFFDNQGTFWFGTASGLVSFNQSKNPEEKARPKVNVVSILINYEKVNYKEYSTEILPDGLPKSLNLPYSKNNLIFEMDAVSFEHQKGLSYQFWLEGLNDTWSPSSASPTLTFTSLPAGDYILHVRSLDLEGRISDEFQFPFEIAAPFYRTWWFILISFVFVTGLFLIFFQYRIRRIAELNDQEKLKYKSKLLSLEQKSMNASMNRHFIFNALNSIQYFINTQDRPSANKYLTNFAQLIRRNLDSVTAEGNVISLEEELERLELYLSLESMRFNNRFDYKINTNDVDTESVLIPPMLLQPFIENSIIHGILPNEEVKGLITIDVVGNENELTITITDNGIGIRNSISKKLNDAGDHKSQGMEITSKRIELIQKLSNNSISLVGPEEIRDNDGSINGTYVSIKISSSNLEI